jgi:GT2 family glycosyltransferase
MTADVTHPDASIIVALEGDAERIPTLMAHLERQTHPASSTEIILVTPPFSPALEDAARHSAEGSPVPTRIISASRASLTTAINEGIRASRGKTILLLDEDLLPSPHWVEHHIAAQARMHGQICTIGALHPHPQLERHALTAWFMSGARSLGNDEGTLPFLDWRRNNLALSRAALVQIGGFDETFVSPQFADAELARRLAAQGVQGIYLPQAIAYIGYASSFDSELERHFRKGVRLFRLHQIVRDPDIHRRYPVYRNPIRRLLDALFVPFYIRACKQTEENTQVLGHVYKRVFFYQRCAGYKHALRADRRRRHA